MKLAPCTDRLDDALRTLDVADGVVDTRRARADLDAIIATDPRGVDPRGADHRPADVENGGGRRRAAAPRLALVGVAAAVLAFGIVLAPPLTGGDEAFATWTARPDALSAAQRPQAAESCRDALEDASPDDAVALASATVAVAEARGEWTTVVLAGPEGFSALCITDSSSGMFADGMIGSVGAPAGYALPGPRDVVATDLGSGTMDAGEISLVAGHAGPQVVGIAYSSPTHGMVEATVEAGRFALWFPGDELRNTSEGVDVEVTLADGSKSSVHLAL